MAAFADDLTAFLRNAAQLPSFESLVDIYERGSLAKLSWSKTCGLPIGVSAADPATKTQALSAGIVLDPNTAIRILGVYVGPLQPNRHHLERKTVK